MKKRTKMYAFVLAGILCILQILPVESAEVFWMGQSWNKKLTSAEALPQPVCNYQFNNSIGTAIPVIRENDTIEGNNTGTLPSGTEKEKLAYTEGIAGKAIYLDGTYGLKVFPQMESSRYSVSFWVKPEAMDIYTPILCAGEQFLTDSEVSLQLTGDDLTSPILISTSPNGGYSAGKGRSIAEHVWNHICMAVDGNKVQIYVNGKQQSEGMILENMIHRQTEWYFGIDCYNTLFQGSLDNIEFYDSCLSAGMVSALYEREKNASSAAEVTGITLNQNDLILNGYGSEASLYASIEPENAENQNVIWTSSDETVATVENGIVRGWKNGSAVIVAMAEEGGMKAQCQVTVRGILELKGIHLNKSELILQGDGSSEVLTAESNPSGAYLPTLHWETSDSNVVIVDQEGKVTAIANGTAVITAQTEDGEVSASCQVTVEGLSTEVEIESVEFTEDSIALTNKKSTHNLKIRITPSNAANRQCTYYSEDDEVAVVDAEGKVTAVGNGITNICVISSNGRFTDSCQVKVSGFADKKVKSLKLDYDFLKIAQGDTDYLYVETTPVTATEPLYWSSSNTQVADVVPDEFGTSAEIIVYADAVMGSTAIITVSSENGVSAECFVEVAEYSVQKLSIEKSSVCLLPGESFDIDAEIKPDTAASADLVWKSSNPQVAVVNDDGVVKIKKAAKEGAKVKITSMTLSRNKKASCVVKVKSQKVAIKKLKAKKKVFEMYPGDKGKFSVTYSPVNATDHKITYQSQNSQIVRIDKNGNLSVPADYKGTAEVKVTAKSKNGKKVTGIVKVKQKEVKIRNLSISRSDLNTYGGKNTTLYVRYKPSNANVENITWTSSNQDVVKVIGNGKRASVQIRNLSSKGNATITAKDTNGATAACKVSVLPKPKENKEESEQISSGVENQKPAKEEVKSISFGRQTNIQVKPGKTVNLKKMLSIAPEKAEYELTWESKSSYVFVSSKGIVSVSKKAPKNLTSGIQVITNNGKRAAINIWTPK